MATKKKTAPKKEEPVKLTAEDEQIIQETVRAEIPKKTGIVVDGSVASNLLLEDLKHRKKYPHTRDLQTFEGESANELLDWVNNNHIDPLYFATTYEGYLKGENKLVQKLKELQQKDPSLIFAIAEPFKGIPEDDIAKMAETAGVDDEQDEPEEAKEEKEGKA